MPQEKTKRKLPSFIRWILWVLLVQFLLINISAAFYAYRLTHFYNDPSLLVYKPAPNLFAKTWKLFTGPKTAKSLVVERPVFSYETVLMKTASGIPIEGWFGKTDSAEKGTVILFHGITGHKDQFLEEANEFRYWGYNVMLVDFRAHGNSGGHTTTIGFRESEEVKLAYDFVSQKQQKRIFLYGSSLGAVVVAKAVSDYQLQPAGIILEMPFESLQSYLKDKARTLGFPQQPFGFLATFWISVERGFNGFKHQTATYAKNIHCPVLMQWGAMDQFVLEHETATIFKAIASSNKKLVVYDNAQHESFMRNDKAKWRTAVGNFFEQSK
jgi:alpha-beta hydrolase superfamily lysophospholipase